MATIPVTLDQQKQQLPVIWTAMLGAVVLYGAVSFMTISADGDRTTEGLHNAFTGPQTP